MTIDVLDAGLQLWRCPATCAIVRSAPTGAARCTGPRSIATSHWRSACGGCVAVWVPAEARRARPGVAGGVSSWALDCAGRAVGLDGIPRGGGGSRGDTRQTGDECAAARPPRSRTGIAPARQAPGATLADRGRLDADDRGCRGRCGRGARPRHRRRGAAAPARRAARLHSAGRRRHDRHRPGRGQPEPPHRRPRRRRGPAASPGGDRRGRRAAEPAQRRRRALRRLRRHGRPALLLGRDRRRRRRRPRDQLDPRARRVAHLRQGRRRRPVEHHPDPGGAAGARSATQGETRTSAPTALPHPDRTKDAS